MADDVEPVANRFVGGPPPRKATGLLTRNRQPAPSPVVTEQVAAAVAPTTPQAEGAVAAERQRTSFPEAPLTQPVALPLQPSAQATAWVDPPVRSTPAMDEPVPPAHVAVTKITWQLPLDLRERARAMFKATRVQEGDESWGAMLTALLEAECRRREQLYNGGVPYTRSSTNLPPGRPLQ